MIVAYIFTLILVAGGIFILSGAGSTCDGFFGTRVSCSTSNMLIAYIFFLNPIALLAYGFLATIGFVTLLLDLKRK